MRKFFGIACMLLAAIMLAGAGWLINKNSSEENAAGDSAEFVLDTLMQEIQAAGPLTAPAVYSDVDAAAVPTDAAPDVSSVPECEGIIEIPDMPVMEIDGNEYIGYIELPTLDLRLPVMSEWSYPKLRIAPCRYWGSVYDDSMVILAHNYERHFGSISLLEPGTPVQFVDADGNIYKSVVAEHEILEKQDVELMITDEWDLTLFTCTYGGSSRVTVRLKRVLTY